MSPSFCFFDLGPGLPRGFGVPFAPSTAAIVRFLGAGPFRFPFGPTAGGASDDGVFVPFIVVESAGVLMEESVTWGAGVSGDDVGFESGGAAAASWGNAMSAFGESLRMTVFERAGLVDIFATE
jgi:hypothetical protein